MCRFVAYLGEPIYLEDLIAKPCHSLMHQSLRADQAKTVTNGDGFGIGWYGQRQDPAVYREVMPAWSDDNLLSLSRTLSSRLFFAHVRSATGGGIARQNCHPFHLGRWMFMHNGQIGGYPQLRRQLEALLPDAFYGERRGATDSELLFLLAQGRIASGMDAPEAMHEVVAEVQALMRRHDIQQPLRFAAALTDGRQLHVFRLSSDDAPPTLYRRDCSSGTVIASEPLDDVHAGWSLLPPGAVLTLSA